MNELIALVGTPGSLRSDGTARAVVPLSQGYVMVAIDEEALNKSSRTLADDPDMANDLSFFLTLMLRSAGLRTDVSGPLAYLEQDEFQQAAVVGVGADTGASVIDSYVTPFEGTESQAPARDHAFNRALRRIGVQATDADECTAVGLTRYMSAGQSS